MCLRDDRTQLAILRNQQLDNQGGDVAVDSRDVAIDSRDVAAASGDVAGHCD